MAYGNEFEEQLPPDLSEAYVELAPRAVLLDGMATTLLETPDWTQTQLHYETPFGPDNTLILSARNCSRSNPQDTLRLQVRANDSEGLNLYKFMTELDEIAKHQGKYPQKEDAAILLEGATDADPTALRLVSNALRLHLSGYDQNIMNMVSLDYASLLETGSTNYRVGIWHTLIDGTYVGIARSLKEGKQPWEEIDNEYELAIHVRTDSRVVDFQKRRDGIYETFETDPDTGRALRSIVGKALVIGIGKKAIEVDLGENRAKHEEIKDTDRALGFRDLDAERLDRIEEGLIKASAERQ